MELEEPHQYHTSYNRGREHDIHPPVMDMCRNTHTKLQSMSRTLFVVLHIKLHPRSFSNFFL